ncbi:hypothetical protein FJ444_07510 [Aestuariibacter sp. GS-14]|uniref:hypothetical protein n=1 Tax=Aestuariibacter sp. GS-14 TaxID=2590670 RepID=UPI001126B3A3|nr:hypothetical protein [Aestuariibacter sp. GS-14]TPV59992.1 hypothetical protein FJ444_07510 [Aestuariibacter sp. GS-14]
MNFYCTVIFGLAITLSIPSIVFASPDRENIEVITVTGDQSLTQMRTTTKQKQIEFYQAYNAVNTDKYFDMMCDYRADIGSHIKSLECEPRYVQLIRSEQVRDNIHGFRFYLNKVPSETELTPLLRAQHDKAEAHMAKLIQEYPELTSKWNDLLVALYRYESHKALKNSSD